MKRTIAMLGAALVLLLLASGFMAADNIRLSGEKAALTDKFNDQGYQYSLVYHQLQSAKQQIGELTRERDELRLELQDYQPGTETGEAIPDETSASAKEATVLPHHEAVPADELAKSIASNEASNAAVVGTADSSEKPTAEENIFSIDEEPTDAEKSAADLALPLVPAVENAMADAQPTPTVDADTSKQLQQLRQEVHSLRRQVDMLRAQLFATRLSETGMGKVLPTPVATASPAPTARPLMPLDTLFHKFPSLPGDPQWAEETQGD